MLPASHFNGTVRQERKKDAARVYDVFLNLLNYIVYTINYYLKKSSLPGVSFLTFALIFFSISVQV